MVRRYLGFSPNKIFSSGDFRKAKSRVDDLGACGSGRGTMPLLAKVIPFI